MDITTSAHSAARRESGTGTIEWLKRRRQYSIGCAKKYCGRPIYWSRPAITWKDGSQTDRGVLSAFRQLDPRTAKSASQWGGCKRLWAELILRIVPRRSATASCEGCETPTSRRIDWRATPSGSTRYWLRRVQGVTPPAIPPTSADSTVTPRTMVEWLPLPSLWWTAAGFMARSTFFGSGRRSRWKTSPRATWPICRPRRAKLSTPCEARRIATRRDDVWLWPGPVWVTTPRSVTDLRPVDVTLFPDALTAQRHSSSVPDSDIDGRAVDEQIVGVKRRPETDPPGDT